MVESFSNLVQPLGCWAPGFAARRWSEHTAGSWHQAGPRRRWPWSASAGPVLHLCRYWPAGWPHPG